MQSPQEWTKLTGDFYFIKPTGETKTNNTELIENNKEMLHDKTGCKMVNIQYGSFWMGGPGGNIEERPAHIVSVDNFMMSNTEITVKQFSKFIH